MTPTQLRRLAERVDRIAPPEGQEYMTAIECSIVEPGPNGPVETGDVIRTELRVPMPMPAGWRGRDERPQPIKLPKADFRRKIG
jgi:hypothetical protein